MLQVGPLIHRLVPLPLNRHEHMLKPILSWLCADATLGSSSDPEYWISQADSRHTKYRIYIQGCRKSFVEAAAWEYLRTTKSEALSNQLTVLEEFRSHFTRYEDELIQLEGVSENWREVHEMTLEVGETIRWLEQLLCDALVGILVFQAAYLANGYAYQRS